MEIILNRVSNIKSTSYVHSSFYLVNLLLFIVGVILCSTGVILLIHKEKTSTKSNLNTTTWPYFASIFIFIGTIAILLVISSSFIKKSLNYLTIFNFSGILIILFTIIVLGLWGLVIIASNELFSVRLHVRNTGVVLMNSNKTN